MKRVDKIIEEMDVEPGHAPKPKPRFHSSMDAWNFLVNPGLEPDDHGYVGMWSKKAIGEFKEKYDPITGEPTRCPSHEEAWKLYEESDLEHEKELAAWKEKYPLAAAKDREKEEKEEYEEDHKYGW